ncbi:unnamed protein product [Effrenium voratum]|uniref:Protein kinase domain-containing protein n=1 Tax=Effrenium voratum TaxID=2562239 RepID=A0AA36IIF3_9DINO|nr:unnamed protein product [Effrenium voratum]
MGASCSESLKSCVAFVKTLRAESGGPPACASAQTLPKVHICEGCQGQADEFAQGAHGKLLCRSCLRREDEALLAPSEEEQKGLDQLSKVLDNVSWKYWKPGEQPARVLDWMYLGDLKEATDFELLSNRGIGAVLNLINWWELSSRLPEVADFAALYSSNHVEFKEVDSEDRLFFDIVEKCWPACESFLGKCRARNQRVLVNCKACICICWLVSHEGYSLLEAVELVQGRRGTILSNHGFRLQLLRLALRLGRLGDFTPQLARTMVKPGSETHLDSIINQKRMTVRYDEAQPEGGELPLMRRQSSPLQGLRPRRLSLISEEVHNNVNQRALKLELLACLYHRDQKFLDDYEYTSQPPTIIGSGFSGDVVLCRRKEKAAVRQNQETYVRCVKSFNLKQMAPDKLDKLKNEAVIYLSLEHPHIARLFDVYEDDEQVSLVMQYCSGGTLESAIRSQGAFSEPKFQDVAVPMLLAVNYIHSLGIVHRDIKPRNWVYEADGQTIKLIDFGFSVKGYLGAESLQGCMGTLGYLAPEVVKAGLSSESAYTAKCDIWSLGVVFDELLTGEPAFHRDAGQCDGYTEEVVLREIKEVSEEIIEKVLAQVPANAVPLLRRMLTKDPLARPSAREVLDDNYLALVRARIADPPRALPVRVILDRFRAHASASKPSRAWLLAVARSPTYLPWEEFCALRETFKMFDAQGLNGTVNFETFFTVLQRAARDSPRVWNENPENTFDNSQGPIRADIAKLWKAVCGEQESLSYCEFMAVLLPPMEDVFADADSKSAENEVYSPLRPKEHWSPSKPIFQYLQLLKRASKSVPKTLEFDESEEVRQVVSVMARHHRRWALVRYKDGRRQFFDYMDINHKLLQDAPFGSVAESMSRICKANVGTIANCSQFCEYVPANVATPLRDVILLIAGKRNGRPVRRVPLVDADGEIVTVFSSLDFLNLALKCSAPTAVLKSLSAKVFDRRGTILQVSVQQDEPLLNALGIMEKEGLTICPITLRELSGTMGGVVASNVVSAADLKWVVRSGNFAALNMSVGDFVAWRAESEQASLDHILRQQRLQRFNVVSVMAAASLHTLAQRLVDSRLQRIFLASDDIARIVGIVSSRDILLQILDQVV